MEEEMSHTIRTLELKNPTGLHMRHAAEIVMIAYQFDSDIMIQKAPNRANARSIFELLMLGIQCGETFELTATGSDAVMAADALQHHFDTYRDIVISGAPQTGDHCGFDAA